MRRIAKWSIAVLAMLMVPYAAFGQCGGCGACTGECVIKYADEFVTSVPENEMYLMSVEDLAAALDKGEDVVVLDIRPLENYDDGHIEGSLHIPLPMLVDDLDKLPDDKKIAVVCMKDTNSAFAVAVLQMRGFNAWVVEGGVAGWLASGKSLVK